MGSSMIEVGIGLILVYMLLSLIVSQINNIIKNLLNIRGQYLIDEIQEMISDPALLRQVLSHPAINSLLNGDMVKEISANKLTDILVDNLAGSGERLDLLDRLSNTDLVRQLLVLVNDAGLKQQLEQVLRTARSLPDVRAKIEEWFDSGLSRVSEMYTRRMHFWSFVVGLLLAVLLNVDSIYLARTLWNDSVLRQATVEAAITIAEQTTSAEPQADEFFDSVREAKSTVNQFLELRLPIGWFYEPLSEEPTSDIGSLSPLRDTRNLYNFWFANNPIWFTLLLEKLAGLALTTIALMQGAPFWFDLIRKATGK